MRTTYQGFSVDVTPENPVLKPFPKDKTPEELMQRLDAVIVVYNALGNIVLAANRHGWRKDDTCVERAAAPFANLQAGLL